MAKASLRLTSLFILINFYFLGIPPHVDTHSAFEAPIVSLSIWADTVMDFRHEDQHSAVILPRRSLLVMNTQAR